MSKSEVEEQRLEQYVLREDEDMLTFCSWWKSLENEDEVEVQFPHQRHALAGRQVALMPMIYTHTHTHTIHKQYDKFYFIF